MTCHVARDFLLISITPKNIGTNAIICQTVGGVLKNIHTKNIVANGLRLLRALAFATGIQWIPSTHNIVDNPRMRSPFAMRKNSEWKTLPIVDVAWNR